MHPNVPGMLGCWISRRQMWRNALDEGLDMIAVFEDYVTLAPNVEQVLNAVEVAAQDAPIFDIIFVDHRRPHRPFVSLADIDHEFSIGLIRHGNVGISGYIITRNAIEHLLSIVHAYAGCDRSIDACGLAKQPSDIYIKTPGGILWCEIRHSRFLCVFSYQDETYLESEVFLFSWVQHPETSVILPARERIQAFAKIHFWRISDLEIPELLNGDISSNFLFIVITVSFNSASPLRTLLKTIPERCPVIVVDNASEDETIEVAEQFGVAVIPNEQNIGITRACRQSAKATKTSIWFFSILTPNWSRYFYRKFIFDSVGKFDKQIFLYCKMMTFLLVWESSSGRSWSFALPIWCIWVGNQLLWVLKLAGFRRYHFHRSRKFVVHQHGVPFPVSWKIIEYSLLFIISYL